MEDFQVWLSPLLSLGYPDVSGCTFLFFHSRHARPPPPIRTPLPIHNDRGSSSCHLSGPHAAPQLGFTLVSGSWWAPAAMDLLFGRRKTPEELLRQNQRALNRAMRELDRERQKLETQEKKIIADIKKMAKQGQMVSLVGQGLGHRVGRPCCDCSKQDRQGTNRLVL